MKSTTQHLRFVGLLSVVAAFAMFLVLCTTRSTNAQTATSAAKGEGFATAQEAANALIEAAENYDAPALEKILGPASNDIVHTGEPARDAEISKAFAAEARKKMNVKLDRTKRFATLEVGEEEWPFPVPVVKVGPKWYFDAKSGLREILIRRIGRNELDAIKICRGYVEAQNEYALTKHGNSPVNQYAQKIISTKGQEDGLAWQKADGTWDGPIGENVAKAVERGYTNRNEPYHGYFFKILRGQGPAAPLGQLDYLVKGAMIGGFALIAAPAEYRKTGVMTFMVSQDGVVYQKDLGPNTLELAKKIDRFNPDNTWQPVLADEDQP